ncbi:MULTISPECIES: helix-turn-helix domain-containing protein [unclassified Thioalkalivibrio]|uniref:helix-turn-helix domain-containing protein n=1 Tax=unclassified Thioalkalivibrio TaxID=2621013 RepID=UPI0012DF340A|nr:MULTISPECIES: helix-turn-helix domain-containing protein [unclassified Thioalkalivibrio]
MEQKNDFLEIIEHEAQTCIQRFSPLDQRMARDLARSISERVQMRAGGDTHYIPQGGRPARERAIDMLKEGRSIQEVSRTFRVSRRTVQRWVRNASLSAKTPS